MAHGHYRHSRIGKRLSTKHRLKAELNDGGSEFDLLSEIDSLQKPIIPDSGILSDETCDPSNNSICVEHGMTEPDRVLAKRDETTSPGPALIEAVSHIVDTSSHPLFQSTATDIPMTLSESIYDSYTLPASESLAATATASLDIEIMVSPTLAPATQPTIPLPSETTISTSSVTSTQSSLTSTASATQVPSPLRAPSATAINSPAWTSTPLVAPSSSTTAAVTTSPQAHNYWSYSGPSASVNSNFSTSSTSSSPDITVDSISSSSVFRGSGSSATATVSGSAPTTTEAQAPGQDSPSNPDTPKIVGGVVGSVAGLALILVLLLYYLRRRGFLMGKHGHPAILGDPAAGAGIGAREVTERRESNDPLFTASYFAPAFMKRWRQSTITTRSGSTIDSAPSERGFQKISGRKIPPVLTHGGDGYGGGLEAGSPIVPGLSPTSPAVGPIGSSSYAPPPTSAYGMPLDSNYTREVEEHTTPTRPNPVHLPISSAVNVAMPITVTPAQPVAQPQSAIPSGPPRPDGLGRSLPSFDGSRSSRFTEGIDL